MSGNTPPLSFRNGGHREVGNTLRTGDVLLQAECDEEFYGKRSGEKYPLSEIS